AHQRSMLKRLNEASTRMLIKIGKDRVISVLAFVIECGEADPPCLLQARQLSMAIAVALARCNLAIDKRCERHDWPMHRLRDDDFA
ncbi:hypothetical protein SB775_28925, partial [Peribacillus sp. SIMBA_075]